MLDRIVMEVSQPPLQSMDSATCTVMVTFDHRALLDAESDTLDAVADDVRARVRSMLNKVPDRG